MRISFEIPEAILHQLLDPVPLPLMARVRDHSPIPAAIEDIQAAVHQQMLQANAEHLLSGKKRIAIGVGSRGIGKLAEIVTALVRELRSLGAEPFIIPAMGSHGGATAEGQRAVLTHLGVTPERVGAPVESQMETVEIGRTSDNTPVRMDRLAASADGIVFVARVKPHTAFRGTYESGLAKMIAIGLGKQEGAATCHARGFGEMARIVPAVAEVAIAQAPLLFGLAVLENAHDQPARLFAVSASQIIEREPQLLLEAKQMMPRFPFPEIDVLVIDEIGKDISGDGADPNITGRYPTPFADGGPIVSKQVVLDLTNSSDGNANGVGAADFTTFRLASKMDLGRTYPNALTSTVPGPVKLPMVLPSDKLALAAALLTCNAVDHPPRVVRIQNTLRLDEYWVSTGLLPEIEQLPGFEVTHEPTALQFNVNGDLLDMLR